MIETGIALPAGLRGGNPASGPAVRRVKRLALLCYTRFLAKSRSVVVDAFTRTADPTSFSERARPLSIHQEANLKVIERKKMEGFKRTKYTGHFEIKDNRFVGELSLEGFNSSLYLWSYDRHDFFNSTLPGKEEKINTVFGKLDDLTTVSLFQCIRTEGPGHRGRASDTETVYFLRLQPRYIIFGERKFPPHEEIIGSIHFLIDDGNELFFDTYAFGQLLDARPVIRQVVQADIEQVWKSTEKKKIDIGPNSLVAYFTGKNEVFTAITPWGKVSSSHRLNYSLGNPDGIMINNKIWISIEFSVPVEFKTAIDRMHTVKNFCELIAGRPQNLIGIELWLKEKNSTFYVYDQGAQKYERKNKDGFNHYFHALIDIASNPAEFSHILIKWIERDSNWRSARGQFFSNFRKEKSYDIDRLVGAANMFDILPDEALPAKIELTQKAKAIRKECKQLLSRLPNDIDKSTVLADLSRLGNQTLRYKIRHRAEYITDTHFWKLPRFLSVVDEAVKCRNFYVHGTKGKVDYNKPEVLIFLTKTLEFVFGASDLLENGWDPAKGNFQSHPFGQYVHGYNECLGILESARFSK